MNKPAIMDFKEKSLNASTSTRGLEDTRIVFALGIPGKLKTEVSANTELYCAMCGIVPGDIDDYTGYRVRFRVSYLQDKFLERKDELSNLRVLCFTCDRGAKLITTEKPTSIWLLSQIRRAGLDEQRAVLRYLLRKFGSDANLN